MYLATCLVLWTLAQSPQPLAVLAQDAYIKVAHPNASDLFGYALDLDGKTLVVGAPGESSGATGVGGNESDNSAFSAGAVFVFERSVNGWAQTAYLKASNTDLFDRFGAAVAISGDTIVVGAPSESSASGGVNGNQADNSALAAGAAYVFVRSGPTWVQQAYLKASNPGSGPSPTDHDMFGEDVAVLGDTICIGARGEASAATGIGGNQADNSAAQAGAAYVFDRTGTTWVQAAYLKASNTDAGDEFGTSVSVGVATIAVGALGEDSQATGINGDQTDNSLGNPGATYVFVKNSGVWSQQAYLKPSNLCGAFGAQLDIDGETLVVSATYEEGSSSGVNGDQNTYGSYASGAAYVFVRNGSAWSQQAYLKAFDIDPSITHAEGTFGQALDLSHDRLVVGAPGAMNQMKGVDCRVDYALFDPKVGHIGAAYLFERTGTAWHTLASLAPARPQKGESFGDGGSFGFAVALSDDVALAGSPGEDGSGAGINLPYTYGSPASGATFSHAFAPAAGVRRYGDFTSIDRADLFGTSLPAPGANFTFEFAGFEATTTGMLIISGAATSLPLFGGTLLVDPGLSVFGPGSITPVQLLASSPGTFTLAVPSGTSGIKLFAQLAAFTPASPTGLIFSNGLEVTL